jgi:hypothetical protein
MKRTSSVRQSWRCERYPNCEGRGKSDNKKPPITITQPHDSCVQRMAQQEVYARFDRLNALATNSGYNPRTIIKEVISGLSEEARAIIPSQNSMRGRINRRRKKLAGYGKDAESLADIVIPESLLTTIDSTGTFLFHDSGKEDPERMLVFATVENIKWLSKLRDWFGDGTFDIAPKMFTQLYTIHSLKGHKTIPLLYAFLPNKKKETYIRLFKVVSTKIKHMPQSYNADFEQAVFGAVKDTFPECELYGCFFHLSQNMFKKVKSIKLTQDYVFGTSFRQQFKMLQAIAIIPPEHEVEAFVEIKAFVDKKLAPLFEYFKKTNIGKIKRATKRNPVPSERKRPLFPITLWNVRDRTLANTPRTNNNLESWHNAIQLEPKKHMTIYRTIQYLRTEQDFTQCKLVKMSIGEFHDSQMANDKLINVINEYDQDDKLEFLRTMALTLSSIKHGTTNDHVTARREFVKDKYGVEEQPLEDEEEEEEGEKSE